MVNVLLTGATGFLGKEILVNLERSGNYKIYCIVRSTKANTSGERLKKIIDSENVIGIEGDLKEVDCGIEAQIRNQINGKIDLVIHCAASVRFDPDERDKIVEENVQGTKNVLDFSKNIGVENFHYVSTAYVAGNSRSFKESDYDNGQKFKNPYEESKWIAESIVRKEYGSNSTVYRPSIIVGNSKDGRTDSYTGFYGVLKSFWYLKENFFSMNRIKRFFLRNKLSINDQGKLVFPYNIKCSSDSTINLVSVDWVTYSILKVIKINPSGKCYHLVDDNPPRIKKVFKNSLERLGITGFSLDYEKETSFIPKPFHRINKVLSIYQPYLVQEPVFHSDNLKNDLGESYIGPTVVNEKFIYTLIDHALKKKFKREKI